MKRYQAMNPRGLFGRIPKATYKHFDFTAIKKKLLSDCSRHDKKAYVYALESTTKALDILWLNYVRLYCKDTTIPHEWIKGLAPHQYKVSNTDLIY